MNRSAIIALVILFIGLASVSAYFLLGGPAKDNVAKDIRQTVNQQTKEPNVKDATAFKACDVLTPAIAKSILGKIQDPKDSNAANDQSDASTVDMAISTCNYVTPIVGEATDSRGLPRTSGVNLMLQIPKTKMGVASNLNLFNNYPGEVRKVEGLGDKALYSDIMKQTVVLKGDSLYIIWHYVDGMSNSSYDTNLKLGKKLNFR